MHIVTCLPLFKMGNGLLHVLRDKKHLFVKNRYLEISDSSVSTILSEKPITKN